MKKLIVKWLVFALIITVTCYLPGIEVENFVYAMLISAILTLINIFIKPLIKLVTFPINVLTFGIFNLIINFGILYGIAYFIPQYKLAEPLSAFLASIIIAICYGILRKI